MTEQEFVFKYEDYPLIPIKFNFNGRETPLIEALLDSGGDFIVIPEAIAKYLGLHLVKAGCVDTAGGETTLCKTNVDLIIQGNEKSFTYENLEIHVSSSSNIPVLLGRKPIFEDHDITFKKHHNKLILKQVK